jgi:hypothetical protein
MPGSLSAGDSMSPPGRTQSLSRTWPNGVSLSDSDVTSHRGTVSSASGPGSRGGRRVSARFFQDHRTWAAMRLVTRRPVNIWSNCSGGILFQNHVNRRES